MDDLRSHLGKNFETGGEMVFRVCLYHTLVVPKYVGGKSLCFCSNVQEILIGCSYLFEEAFRFL